MEPIDRARDRGQGLREVVAARDMGQLVLERHAQHSARHAALISEVLDLLPGGPRGVWGGGQPPQDRGGLGGSPPRPTEPRQLAEPLSQGETRVLRYLPTNLSAPEIARELSVSVHTVRTHIRHVCGKLGAHLRARCETNRARSANLHLSRAQFC